jgi:hypothetical protein
MTLTNRTTLLLLLGTMVTGFILITAAACISRYSPEVNTNRENPGFELRLDYQPFKDPVALYLFIDANGSAQGVSYNNYQLAMLNKVNGSVPDAEVTRVLAALRSPGFRDASRRRDFTGEGLSRGDQIHLWVKFPEGETGEVVGFIDDMPSGVRDLVESLRAIVNHLHKSPLADGYVRGRPITEDRFRDLQDGGKIRVLAIPDLPSPLQAVLTEALHRPYDFIALSQSQYDQLLTLPSQGHDLFLVDHGSGYQLTLFRSVR